MSKLTWSKAGVRWVLLAVLCIGPVTKAFAADTIAWDKQRKTLSARVETWELQTLLGHLSQRMGWQVFLEPGTEKRISVRFKDLPIGEGLKQLLGDLSFALVPGTNGPASLYVFRTSLQQATQLVADAERRKGRIPNELIVTLRSDAKQRIEELAKALGAKVVGKVDGLNTYRLRFADEAAAQAARDVLGENRDVAGTDSNFYVEHPTRIDNVELSSPANFALKPKLGDPGNQVVVALIDTPVQPMGSKMSEFLLPSIHVAGQPTLPPDLLTHGTSMAETILHGLTYAPQEEGGSSVRVLPVDVYGNNPDTTTFDVASGIYAALASGASIVNLSLGGEGDSEFLARLIREAHRQGVLFFGAAGNQPTTDPTFPAAYPDVIAVTAGDKHGNIAPYANRGGFVDVIAPGVSMVEYQGQSYLVRGTSAATAYVSGTAAGYRATGAPPQNVAAKILETLGARPAD